MQAADALVAASERGMQLWVEGAQLRFRAPAGAVDEALRAALKEHREALLALVADPGEGWHPLSGTQRGIWLFEQLAPGCPAYHLPVAATLRGPLEPTLLRDRLAAAVARHGALRTSFPCLDGVPVARVRPEGDAGFVHVDATGWGDEQVAAALKAAALAPFDLAEGPLVRLHLLRRGPEHHELGLTLHHAVADLSSMSLLLRELCGEDPGAVAPFADFARAEARLDPSAAWAHARAALEGAPWDLPLPVDFAPVEPASHRGRVLRFALPEDLARRLEAIAAEREVTLFSLLLTSFGVLLERYTAQADLVLGAPVSGRAESRFAGTLGPFVRVVPLRLRLPAATPFRQLVDAVHATVVGALSHAELPLDTLLQGLDRQRGARPRVLFAWQSLAPGAPAAHRELVSGGLGEPVELGGLTWTPRALELEAVDFELAVTASRSRAGIAVLLEAEADRFAPETLERIAANWARLLEDVAAGAEAPRAVVDAERGALLGPLARGERPAPGVGHPPPEFIPRSAPASPPPSVLASVASRAREAPMHPALIERSGALSYRALQRWSAGLAGSLPPGGRVGLLAAPGPDLLAGLLAILHAGGAFVPLAEGDPEARQRAMLDDADAVAVLAGPGFAGRAAALGRPVVLTHAAEAQRKPEPRRPDSLAYIAFTSGSTGRPKGVPITDANLAPVLAWGLRDLQLGASTRVLQNLSVAFDFGIFELLTTLLAGGTLCVPGRGDSLDRRLDFAQEQGADTLHTTPSHARLLLSAGRPLSTLRTAHFGGEVLPLDLVERLLAAMHPDGQVVNGYGPTEASINCTVARFDRASLPALRRLPSVPIGAPIAPFVLRVLDGAGEPAPLGGRGELHIGGPCVASGYLGTGGEPVAPSPFGPDPFQPGERLYRTGDLVRLMPSGQLLFCGRRDQQVQLRGRRVELEEVESALRRHPAVAAAAVDLREGPAGDRLVAWVVPEAAEPAPAAPSEASLRAHAASLLPAALIPARFVCVPALPNSRAGKLDRAALVEPPSVGSTPPPAAAITPSDPSDDPLLAAVLSTLRAVLHQPALAADADFFAFGDSLLAVELAHRLGRALDLDVPGNAVFGAPTARSLTALLRGRRPPGLVPFRDGPGRPLFVLPPGELELPALRHLASLLPSDQPVFALQPASAGSLPALLDRYAGAIEAGQPAGPLRLLGYCVGGQLAFALAGLLEARGREVSWVLLVDSPFAESALGDLAWRGARRLARRWGARGSSRLARHARGLFLDPGVVAHARLLRGHRPRRWRGRALYWMARRSHFRLMPTHRRWRSVSPGLEFGWLPGDHDSLLHEPHVRVFAQRLTALLR